jgi:restriction endonuclease S subunit
MRQKLTDIAEIQTGYQFRKKIEPDPTGNYRVVQIRDFDENLVLQKKNLLQVKLDKPAQSFLVSKSDILFLSRGHKNWATAIVDDLQETIAVGHFFILRLKNSDIIPEYLTWYLNQAPAQEYLYKNARRGTHMPLIPLSVFKELTAEVPSRNIQQNIIELNKLLEKEKQLLRKLNEKRSLFINALCLKAAKTKKEK